jgi:hypothetical protein
VTTPEYATAPSASKMPLASEESVWLPIQQAPGFSMDLAPF